MLGSILAVPAKNAGLGLGVSIGILRGRGDPQGDLVSARSVQKSWELERVMGWVECGLGIGLFFVFF